MSKIRIVLVETSHPGNIGAVARAMKNMCLEHLFLVNPRHFPDREADARASGAQDLLKGARVVGSLEEAVGDCSLVVGTSARQRSTVWRVLDPRATAEMVMQRAQSGEVALVFGRESSGLTAEELDRCTHLVHIPSNPEYSSLNIGMAVQIICYELRMLELSERHASGAGESASPSASVEQMEGFFLHLEQALHDFRFLQAGREDKMMRRLRRLFHRAGPDQREVNILRGILSSAQGEKSMRTPVDEDPEARG